MTSPTPSPTATSATAVGALLAAYQAEQVAAFGYGTLGPRLASATADQAHVFEQAHRDLAAGAVRVLVVSAPPGQSLGSYQLPIAAVDDASARQLAVLLEAACASAWRFVVAQLADVGASAGPVWPFAMAALRDSAVRAVAWRKTIDPAPASVAFPGI